MNGGRNGTQTSLIVLLKYNVVNIPIGKAASISKERMTICLGLEMNPHKKSNNTATVTMIDNEKYKFEKLVATRTMTPITITSAKGA